MISPMLAVPASDHSRLVDEALAYECKFDGIRCVSVIGKNKATLYSREGNVKNQQFPEIVSALSALKLPEGTTLDGEIVPIDTRGRILGFQALQGRINLMSPGQQDGMVAYCVFDILQHGQRDLRMLPLRDRRVTLENDIRFSPLIRLSSQAQGDGQALYQQAKDEGWEGLMVKRLDSPYREGKRSSDWQKLKFSARQEFVICGWTDPQGSRAWFGALILGVYEGKDLVYCGKVGTGWTAAALEKVMGAIKTVKTLEESPFTAGPAPDVENEHWIEPKLVAEVRYNSLTWDRKLRHASFLGLRDDKKAKDVRREAA